MMDWKRAARCAALGGMAWLLAGCATPYKAYEGADAAKVRLSLMPPYTLLGVMAHLTPVNKDGSCGKRMTGGRLSQPFTPAPTQNALSPQPVPIKMPRADMVGSPPPERTDTTEWKLAPGRYLLTLFSSSGGVGTVATCGISTDLDVQGGDQLWVAYNFDVFNNRCGTTIRRLKSVESGFWEATPLQKPTICPKE